MRKKRIWFIYGLHGAGKTHVAKEISSTYKFPYYNTDYADSPEYDPKQVGSLQKNYFEYTKSFYKKLIEFPHEIYFGEKNIIVVDFGLYQQIPYHKYFSVPEQKEWEQEIDHYESLVEQHYDVKRLFVTAPLQVIEQRIIQRYEKFPTRNLDFELESLHSLEKYFRELFSKTQFVPYVNLP